jgi:GDP-mannose pyrophosphatase NudK
MNVELVERLFDDWYRIERYVVRQTLPPGRAKFEPLQFPRLACGRGDRVAVLPYRKSDRSVVLIQQFRLPVLLVEPEGRGLSVELAGGLIGADSPECCARREVLEETGLMVRELKLTIVAFCHPTFVTERTFLFLAPMEDLTSVGPGGGIHSEGEDIQVLRLTLKTALEMVEDGAIRDIKTVMALYHLAQQHPKCRMSFRERIRNICKRYPVEQQI